jgi:hypothetical protein
MDSLFSLAHSGLLTGPGFFFIIMPPPGGARPLTLLFGRSRPCICLLSVSGSGIPGVGVAPGFSFLFATFGSGIPGVGVAPFGSVLTPFTGMPTVEFADGGTGDIENSGGIFALFVDDTLTVTFVFDTGVEPQAKTNTAAASKAIRKHILFIRTNLNNANLKWLCRFRGCVPGGQRRRPNRHGQVSNGFGR